MNRKSVMAWLASSRTQAFFGFHPSYRGHQIEAGGSCLFIHLGDQSCFKANSPTA